MTIIDEKIQERIDATTGVEQGDWHQVKRELAELDERVQKLEELLCEANAYNITVLEALQDCKPSMKKADLLERIKDALDGSKEIERMDLTKA